MMYVMVSTGENTRRRKSPSDRTAEIIAVASAMALADGLESLTLRRVADALGVKAGLISHYFPSADALVVKAFGVATERELTEIFESLEKLEGPEDRLVALIQMLLGPDYADMSLLWFNAWHASRHRPGLSEEVVDQMNHWVRRVSALISEAATAGFIRVDDPQKAATRILAMIDGLSVRHAVGSKLDYGIVQELAREVAERELGLPQGTLSREES